MASRPSRPRMGARRTPTRRLLQSIDFVIVNPRDARRALQANANGRITGGTSRLLASRVRRAVALLSTRIRLRREERARVADDGRDRTKAAQIRTDRVRQLYEVGAQDRGSRASRPRARGDSRGDSTRATARVGFSVAAHQPAHVAAPAGPPWLRESGGCDAIDPGARGLAIRRCSRARACARDRHQCGTDASPSSAAAAR